jgi:hypothetical protein
LERGIVVLKIVVCPMHRNRLVLDVERNAAAEGDAEGTPHVAGQSDLTFSGDGAEAFESRGHFGLPSNRRPM